MLLNHSRANSVMEEEGLDGLIASTPENVTYVTGHRGDYWIIRTMSVRAVLARRHERPVLVGPGSLVTEDMRDDFIVSAYGGIPLVVSEESVPDEYDERLLARRRSLEAAADADTALYRALVDLGLSTGRIAVDERNFTRGDFARLEEAFPQATVVDGYETFRKIRAVKTPLEIERLAGSVRATENGIRRAAEILEPGVTELALQRAFNVGVAELGGFPLFTVICSGHRSAHTTTTPTERRLQKGDVVRLDVGARFHYYTSDIARTYIVGEPDATQQRYWDAIVEGEKAAIAAMKPGITAGEIFDIAVQVTRAAGLPQFKRQHVGHGIGIDLYDMPVLTPNNPTLLEEGMVFCVETPIYEVGYAGFQVEDTLVLKADGIEMLSTLPRELVYHS